ncbi:hypothetical protein J6590_014272 [Homalodisca vitripennis]|nr:hypothetical protein J6590_014272 [Homalodisca vitripennis]
MSGTSSTYLLTPGILMRQDNCFDSTTGGTTPAKLSWRLSKHVGHIIYLFTYTRVRQGNCFDSTTGGTTPAKLS